MTAHADSTGKVYLLGLAALLGMAACGAPDANTTDDPETGEHAAATKPKDRVEGTIQVSVADYVDQEPEYTFYVERDSEVTRINMSKHKPGGRLRAGAKVRVNGRRNGKVIDIDDPEVDIEEVAPPGDIQAATAPRKTLVILINFADNPVTPVSVGSIKAQMFGNPDSVNALYKEQSFGLTSFSGINDVAGDVIGYYTSRSPSSGCDFQNWTQAMPPSARPGYDNYIYAFAGNTGCAWAGVAYVRGNIAWTKLSYTSLFVQITAHEIGHNLGLYHANSYRCSTGAVGGTCTSSEYADPYDMMGFASAGVKQTNTFNKTRLGWLPSANMRTLTASEVVTLVPMETSRAGLQMVRLRRADGKFYYLDYRQPTAAFDRFGGSPGNTGVHIHLAGDTTSDQATNFVDTAPSSSTFNDAPLVTGATFVDTDSKIGIKTLAATPQGAQIEVTFGGVAPNPAPSTSFQNNMLQTDLNTALCMDVYYGLNLNGTPVQLYDCHGGTPQRWSFANGSLQALGKCLTARLEADAWPQVTIDTCAGLPQQRWLRVGKTFKLDSPTINRCVGVHSGAGAAQTPLTATACDGSTAQMWTSAP